MDYKPDLSPEEKLNVILQKVVNMSEAEQLTYAFIANLVGASDYTKEVFEILLKLLKDGYVTSPQGGGHGYYYSNFDGRLFIDNGGYVKAKEILETNLKVSSRILIQEQTYRLRLLWATWSAGIAAALLLLWNVFLWINPTYSNFPYILFGIIRK